MVGVAQTDIDTQSSGSSTPPIGSVGHRKIGSLNADELEQLKSKTSFRLAHPPPVTKHKQRLRIRPRVVLQLHQFSENSRANLDVLPSTIFAPRLSSKFPKLFRGKAGLGPHDLVVMSSGVHRPNSRAREDNDPPVEDESWDTDEAIATICQARRTSSDAGSSTEICFTNGKSWHASQLSSGSYEFTSENEDGSTTTARWVLKRKTHQRSSTAQDALQQSNDRKDRRFNFSLINPTRRKHPVIASMTRDSINVNNRYQAVVDTISSPSEQLASTDNSPSLEQAGATNYFDGVHSSGSQVQKGPSFETDESLRTLIVITGIWVVFKEGWSKNFSYDDVIANNGSDSAVRRNTSRRHASLPSTTNKSLGASDSNRSNTENGNSVPGRRSTGQILRTSLSLRTSSKRSPTRSANMPARGSQTKGSSSETSKNSTPIITHGKQEFSTAPEKSLEHSRNGNRVRKGRDGDEEATKKGSETCGLKMRKRMHSLLGVFGHHSTQ